MLGKSNSTVSQVDATIIHERLAFRQEQAVTDLHLLCTALHPLYKKCINKETVYERALSKVRDIAKRRQLNSPEIVQEFGELHNSVCAGVTMM